MCGKANYEGLPCPVQVRLWAIDPFMWPYMCMLLYSYICLLNMLCKQSQPTCAQYLIKETENNCYQMGLELHNLFRTNTVTGTECCSSTGKHWTWMVNTTGYGNPVVWYTLDLSQCIWLPNHMTSSNTHERLLHRVVLTIMYLITWLGMLVNQLWISSHRLLQTIWKLSRCFCQANNLLPMQTQDSCNKK